MNELPPQFFSDAALNKRVAIIEFNQQVATQAKDTDFAAKIVANELPGVLNWIIAGLDRLLLIGRLNPPQLLRGGNGADSERSGPTLPDDYGR